MIFDREKWERIKNKREVAGKVFEAANEDFNFEKGNFDKSNSFFRNNFRNSYHQEIHDAVTQLLRMNPADMSAIRAEISKTQAMVEKDTSIYDHLQKLLGQLLTLKLATAKKEQAREALTNNGKCFSILEEFAKKHIQLPTSTGPYPVQDDASVMGFNQGGHYE